MTNVIQKIAYTLSVLAAGEDAKEKKCYNYAIIQAILKKHRLKPDVVDPQWLQHKITEYRNSHNSHISIAQFTDTELINELKVRGYEGELSIKTKIQL